MISFSAYMIIRIVPYYEARILHVELLRFQLLLRLIHKSIAAFPLLILHVYCTKHSR